MTTWQAILLGIVQGLTEFLPISSTAHLRIVPALLGWPDPGAAFTAVLQSGTLVAVLVYFWRDIVQIAAATVRAAAAGRPLASHEARLGWMIVVGTIPIVVCGLLLKEHIETTFRSLEIIASALIVVGLVLAAAEMWVRRLERNGVRPRELEQLRWSDAVVVGLAQAVALVPGSSRSGTTIAGGLFCGLSRYTAARFSFLLSLPSVLAAAVLELYHERAALLATSDDTVNLVVGTVVSGLAGYAAIAFLIRYLKTHTTWVFIWYRLLLGGALFAMLAAGKIE